MKWFKRFLFLVIVVPLLLALAVGWMVWRQGHSEKDWAGYTTAKVHFDENGIPTIEGDSWEKVIEAQGYVIASQRMFHMDLLRRSAGGRLAELFGPKAVPVDRKRHLEDWDGVAKRAYERLSPNTKTQIDAYTKGVNAFIENNLWRWGIEYALLFSPPKRWTGSDTMLIMMLMSEQLATAAPGEIDRERWQDALPEDWFGFLFAADHPWNQPMFGDKPHPGPVFPKNALPKKPISTQASLQVEGGEGPALGSNSWAWCGKTGCFLANDPHLRASVPHLWFANRLRVSEKDWFVGVSIPGLPGVVLGMNPYLAWGFTNVGEDVDDYLEEKVQGDKYLSALQLGGEEVWRPITKKSSTIKVKGGPAVTVESRFTHRGPLIERPGQKGYYSRQWLPLKSGILNLPSELNYAKNWGELNAALDHMRVPAQNVLMVDRQGNMGYRASGTGVRRKVTGRFPQDALKGEWMGFEAYDKRPRKFIAGTMSSTPTRSLATANERIWVDRHGQRWASDLRKHRIRTALAEGGDALTASEMIALQLDTKSPYHHLIVRWVVEHASFKDAPKLKQRWAAWNGEAAEEPEIFTDALEMERALVSLCLSRVRQAEFYKGGAELQYRGRMQTGWVIAVLSKPQGLSIFGLDEAETADFLVKTAVQEKHPPYHEENRWGAQHPFAKRVPYVGPYFAIDAPQQVGWSTVPRVERPSYGASTRLVWNLSQPLESRWGMPVGQSGHVFSKHYKDLQKRWFAGSLMKVFDPKFQWWFAPTQAAH